MPEDNDILFGSDYTMTARQERVLGIIEKARESIISACNKCENGFVSMKNKKKSLSDLAFASATECSCRIKGARVSKLIESGIPKHFYEKKNFDLSVDTESSNTIELYINNIEKVFDKSIGMLLLDSGIKSMNIGYARQLVAIKILLAVLDTQHTAHYIDMNRYFNLKLNFMKHFEYQLKCFLEEVEAVDFLCIDNVTNVHATEYLKNTLFTLLSERSLHGKPTILVTSYDQEGLIEYLGPEIMNQIIPTSVKVAIKKYDGKRETFINLKRKIA